MKKIRVYPNVIKWAKALMRFVFKFSTQKLSTGPHITRYYMYEHLSTVFKSLDSSYGNKILSISESKHLCALLNIVKPNILEVNFPEYNLIDLPFKDGEFDWIVSDQVLEHIKDNPQRAIDESYRVLRPGGIAVHTTCFINPIHGSPDDFWRFTPSALCLLSKQFSKIIDVGGWGNIYVWFIDWLGLRYLPIPYAKWHPLHKLAVKNDKNWPIVTWIVAQK